MARPTGPKEKIERRLGERLGLKGERSNSPKSGVVRRPYAPGQHGPTARPPKRSEFGTQLRSKQKVRHMYRLMEKQFKATIKRAIGVSRTTSPYQQIVHSLELRLDNVIFRMGLAQSRDQARQLVSHGHVTLNGKRAKTPSITVRTGDVLGVREQSRALPFFATLAPRWLEAYTPPAWLEVDRGAMTAKVKGPPAVDEAGIQQTDLQSIIEFYSR